MTKPISIVVRYLLIASLATAMLGPAWAQQDASATQSNAVSTCEQLMEQKDRYREEARDLQRRLDDAKKKFGSVDSIPDSVWTQEQEQRLSSLQRMFEKCQ